MENTDYPDAVAMELSLEFALNSLDATSVNASISPTYYDAEENCYSEGDLICEKEQAENFSMTM